MDDWWHWRHRENQNSAVIGATDSKHKTDLQWLDSDEPCIYYPRRELDTASRGFSQVSRSFDNQSSVEDSQSWLFKLQFLNRIEMTNLVINIRIHLLQPSIPEDLRPSHRKIVHQRKPESSFIRYHHIWIEDAELITIQISWDIANCLLRLT